MHKNNGRNFFVEFTFSIQFSLDNKYTHQIYLFHERGEGLLKKTFISSFNSSNQIDWFSGFLHFLWIFNEMPLRTLEFLQSCALVYMYFPSWNKMQTYPLLKGMPWSYCEVLILGSWKCPPSPPVWKAGWPLAFSVCYPPRQTLFDPLRECSQIGPSVLFPCGPHLGVGLFSNGGHSFKGVSWPSMLVSVWDYNINRRSDYITEKPATSIVRSLILGWNSNGLTACALSSSLTHSWSFSAMDSHTSL